MEKIWTSILTDANTQWVLLGTLLLGVASGVLGSFALLRKQSLIGDAVAHAALPGICLAFLFMGEKHMLGLLVGAALTGLLASYSIQFISGHSRLKEDTAIGLVLSVFFGLGIVLLTKVIQSSSGNKSGLDDFIFGQAASMIAKDVQLMAGTAVVLIIVTFFLFKEFKVSTFDPQFAQGIGLPVGFLNFLFSTLLVITVVIGIQAVGVILMSAMLIIPAISARYWTDSLGWMVIISGTVGAISGVIGTLISTLGRSLATGPFIVLTSTTIFLVSILFAPKRGLLAKWWRRKINDWQLAAAKVLMILLEQNKPLPFTKLSEHVRTASWELYFVLKKLERHGWIETKNEAYQLTDEGKAKGEQWQTIERLRVFAEIYPQTLSVKESQLLDQATIDTVNEQAVRQMEKKFRQKEGFPYVTKYAYYSKGEGSYEL
jgi:manganese/zinc/iron transport system permease protein